MNSIEVADQLNQRLLDLIEAGHQDIPDNGGNPIDEIMEEDASE